MKSFDLRTQNARTGNVTNPRSCKWLKAELNDNITVEIIAYEHENSLVLHAGDKHISIPIDKLTLQLISAYEYDKDIFSRTT
jgi:hypothetical protein